MNRNSKNYEEPVRVIADRPTNDKGSALRSEKYRQKSRGLILDLEERIDRGTRVVLKTGHLVMVILFVVAFPIIKLSLIEGVEIAKHLNVATKEASSQPGPERSTVYDQPRLTDLIATNLPVNNASLMIDNVRQRSASSSVARKKRETRPHLTTVAASRTSPTSQARSQKVIADFTLRQGIPTGFEEENGIVRARELPSRAAIPNAWGNSAVARR